ncbi:MAG: hypothetical protein IAE78_02640 [Myxococcus sp.]|nr:hypothetical protein [Myxococcus sp.]
MRVVSIVLLLSLAGCTCSGPRIQVVREEDAGLPPGCVPTVELCNGRDDDCDELIDEDQPSVECGVGACRRQLSSCLDGAPQACTPGAPTAERCNGVDDDCNGATDENLMPTTCGVGECGVVQSTCALGAPQVCTPGAPGAEVCNGKDDDCDGTVDEGLLTNASGDLRLTDDPASSDFVYMASSTNGFGLAWQDTRDGANAKGEIYFAALDKRGVRQGGDVRVTVTPGVTTHPALAFTGARWGLVYADDSVDNLELYYRAVSGSGQPLGAPVRLTTAPLNSDWPDVVWTGTEFAVAWEDERLGANRHDLFFMRFDESGTRLGSEVRVTTDPQRQGYPILKWSGQGYGLAWTDWRDGNREIYFRRLGADGALLGPEVRVTSNAADSAWADLAWNSDRKEWALVWHDTRDGNAEVYFQRLSEQGQKVGGEVRLTSAGGFSGYASIDWNGFEYGVSWQDDRVTAGRPAIYFMQLSATGVKNGNDLRLSSGSGSATFTTALWNGSTFAFSWRDDRNPPAGNTELYFAYVGCP